MIKKYETANNKSIMELSKVGGVYWPTDPTKIPQRRPTAISALEKTDSIADFIFDSKMLKSSTSVETMLMIKRDKKRRQFMNQELIVERDFK